MKKAFSTDLLNSFSEERIRVAVLLLRILAVLSPFVAFGDYLQGHLTSATGALLNSIAIPLLLYASRSLKYRSLPVLGLLFLLMSLFALYVALEHLPPEKLVWSPLYAVIFYFIAGKRLGTVLSVIAMLLLVMHFLLHPWLFHLPVPVYLMGETLGAFLFAMLISYSYEHIRSKHEQALRDLAQQAETASQAKGEFLSNMSHEIRTPMNSVLGMTYLALKSVEDDKQRDYLEKIRYSGELMQDIIDDILNFSKIEAGKMGVNSDDFDLARLLNNLINQLAWRAEEKGLQLRLELEPGMPTCLRGDALHLNQVLLNLLGNAIKFTEQGSVVVRVRLLETLNNSYRLRFEVLDSGSGIAEEQQGALFQPFYQVDAAATRKVGGTGLGLAISKRLVELMGGEIGVESKLGAGYFLDHSAVVRWR